MVILMHAILFGTQSCIRPRFPLQTKRKLSAKWKVAKAHNFNRLVFSSLASSPCATDMVATAKFSVDHLGNVGVWIDMATSYQGQRLKEYLTVIQMVRVLFFKLLREFLIFFFISWVEIYYFFYYTRNENRVVRWNINFTITWVFA